jgi:two-component system, sensor histidine kinase and response regulator
MNSGAVPLVLVIDNDPDQLMLVRQAAARAGGLRIMSAESGTEALAQLEARESMRLPYPDLVLTDLKMPDMSGLEFMRVLRTRTETSNVPVLFLTSSGYNRDRILVHLAGAGAFFEKPIRFGDLVAMMKVLPSYVPQQPDPEMPTSIDVADSADPTACGR